ncbi:neuronal acetylcholine receptor subunit alpha-6-like [Pecten maximus]|uniref:neuronal acetylcholine receptor subunit alpha-6-like n=1 Tax=Pecten maximus TaxID=6579 RepID=UPI001458D504|nr:neuronal acetylcholine receptor subunit alpha-6-like [Pecten maximus]
MYLCNSLVLYACFICYAQCEEKIFSSNISYESVIELQDLLLKNYSKDFRPIQKQAEAIVIQVNWELRSINGFNEVAGELVTSSRFINVWKNEMMQWNTSVYHASYIILNSEKVWNPVLALDNPTGEDDIKSEYKEGTIRCNADGYHFLTVAVQTRTSCEPNMRLYPFDHHNCTLKIYSPEFFIGEMKLIPSVYTKVESLQQDSQWEATDIYAYNDDTVMYSRPAFGISFKRKPEFIIINLLTPIVLLCFLNLAVYILPPQSGERVSFSVTMFLSFSVYMTLISEKMPVTNPVSIFTQYLVCNVGYSAFILFTTVVGLRFHLVQEDEEMMPGCVSKFVRFLSCACSATVKSQYDINKDFPIASNGTMTDVVSRNDVMPPVVSMTNGHSKKDQAVRNMLKKDFGKLIDRICLVVLSSTLVIGNITFVMYFALS